MLFTVEGEGAFRSAVYCAEHEEHKAGKLK